MRYWLREIRRQRGLTQAEVAERVDISRSYYVRIETERGCPSIGPKTAMKIAMVLNFPWTRFFDEDLAEIEGNVRTEQATVNW